MTSGRGVDRGNATLTAIKADFRRLGLTPFDVGSYDSRWNAGDSAAFEGLVRLRNVLAHGNDNELQRLRVDGVMDTVTWARRRLPALNRLTRAMDRLVWDHVKHVTGEDPWR